MLGTTQNCVTHTALSPLAKGYKIRVLSSLCTAPTELIHGIALEALKDRDWIDVV
ncbi:MULTISPECIES: isochorismatase family protein [Moraxella]|uniref:isochorismatase family protein n=1 Tax=Moraxella TaxID=475 RepID=UPI0012DBEE96|nr:MULTISPECIES: isochorismatase family protein [Moraxella]MBE9579483.1 isochorismatase family protein [Moraxella sp. K1664]MBE9588848.1 isochorismatase family protein [Moraxella sp. K1630]MBE9589638.1 isochorismatase family protein [Moraxella sp. K127]MBE9597060.1 isochorismatase family protein [Moraxella sp. K2450]MDH9219639.1 isochorismatase family protein [Moraxella lacunata]